MRPLSRPEVEVEESDADIDADVSHISVPLGGVMKRCLLTKGCVLMHLIFNLLICVALCLLTGYDAYHLFFVTTSPSFAYIYVAANVVFIVVLVFETFMRWWVEDEWQCGEFISKCENKFDLIIIVISTGLYLADYIFRLRALSRLEVQALRGCRIGLQALLLLSFLKQLFNSVLDFQHVSEGYLEIDLKLDPRSDVFSDSDSSWLSDRRRTLLRQPSRNRSYHLLSSLSAASLSTRLLSDEKQRENAAIAAPDRAVGPSQIHRAHTAINSYDDDLLYDMDASSEGSGPAREEGSRRSSKKSRAGSRSSRKGNRTRDRVLSM